VECEGHMQGLMMISTIGWRGRTDIQAGRPVLYLEYIERAFLSGLVENPQFSGVGIALMQAAVPVSVDEGFAGRIALHSLPQSQPFCRRALEEDGCVITVVGSELVKAMNFDGVSEGKSRGPIPAGRQFLLGRSRVSDWRYFIVLP
jgi:hypothetical protein